MRRRSAATSKLHEEIRARHRQAIEAGFESALLLSIAAGAEPDPKVSNAETNSGENHQKHDRIDDGHFSGTAI